MRMIVLQVFSPHNGFQRLGVNTTTAEGSCNNCGTASVNVHQSAFPSVWTETVQPDTVIDEGSDSKGAPTYTVTY